MKDEKNALAELADRFAKGTITVKDIDAAGRIVAELAKVSSGRWENICDGPPAYICDANDLKIGCCIGNCRAIAEEGN